MAVEADSQSKARFLDVRLVVSIFQLPIRLEVSNVYMFVTKSGL